MSNVLKSAENPISSEISAKLDADIARQKPVPEDSRAVLRVSNLKMYFPVTRGLLKRKVGEVKAVDDVTFHVLQGETIRSGRRVRLRQIHCGQLRTAQLRRYLRTDYLRRA